MCFTEKCLETAHIVDHTMSNEQREAVEHWAEFYEKEKTSDGRIKYPFVGLVVDD
jgi:4-hydroxyphenylpyruvate dioxygenase-like putative hemolysin